MVSNGVNGSGVQTTERNNPPVRPHGEATKGWVEVVERNVDLFFLHATFGFKETLPIDERRVSPGSVSQQNFVGLNIF